MLILMGIAGQEGIISETPVEHTGTGDEIFFLQSGLHLCKDFPEHPSLLLRQTNLAT